MSSGSAARSRSPSEAPVATIRGRAGYRTTELNTIPAGLSHLVAPSTAAGDKINLLTNFIKIKPMQERKVLKYRVDIEPNTESVTLRRQLLRRATEQVFNRTFEFDGMFDLRSSVDLPDPVTTYNVADRDDTNYTIRLTKQGEITWGSFEMIRLYNMGMKQCLREMGFFKVPSPKPNAYVHPGLFNDIGQDLVTMRGFATSVNIHKDQDILMNLEPCHKLMQKRNCLQMMQQVRADRERIRVMMTGSLVVPAYNRIVYRVEDVNFDMNPMSTFPDRQSGTDKSYVQYYREKYNLTVSDTRQPLLLVTQHSRRRALEGQPQHDIYLVPEFCNRAGLTTEQLADNRLKTELIRASQLSATDRVGHMRDFSQKFHSTEQVVAKLTSWGYSLERMPVKVEARVLPTEKIGARGSDATTYDKWPTVQKDGGFEEIITRGGILSSPTVTKWCIIVPKSDERNLNMLKQKLLQGFNAISFAVPEPSVQVLNDDSPRSYSNKLQQMPVDFKLAVVFMSRKDKSRYDLIKKHCSIERGIVSQVVTSQLLMDERKSSGAAKKIAVQIAAKMGGEPWRLHLPLKMTMMCGYDTWHDTTQQGQSFGAFLASMNDRFSRWFSKTDRHARTNEFSTTMAANMVEACHRWKELNGGERFPERIYLYRDGVGDGDLQTVYEVELRDVLEALKKLDPSIKLAMIIVNKRIGARFYLHKGGSNYDNAPCGTVVDKVVTRQTRYDFYLVSQSTRFGTVSPTYYNIIHDDTELEAAKHQHMAYKLCLLYYNWTGSVRVPAPCQYAHKLAYLCGENLHSSPNNALQDNLHFL